MADAHRWCLFKFDNFRVFFFLPNACTTVSANLLLKIDISVERASRISFYQSSPWKLNLHLKSPWYPACISSATKYNLDHLLVTCAYVWLSTLHVLITPFVPAESVPCVTKYWIRTHSQQRSEGLFQWFGWKGKPCIHKICSCKLVYIKQVPKYLAAKTGVSSFSVCINSWTGNRHFIFIAFPFSCTSLSNPVNNWTGTREILKRSSLLWMKLVASCKQFTGAPRLYSILDFVNHH